MESFVFVEDFPGFTDFLVDYLPKIVFDFVVVLGSIRRLFGGFEEIGSFCGRGERLVGINVIMRQRL